MQVRVINEGEVVTEARYERKDRVRKGKVQRRKKVSSKDGYKMQDGKSKRMSPSERRERSRSQKKASKKRKSSQSRSNRRRSVSMRKRKSRLGESHGNEESILRSIASTHLPDNLIDVEDQGSGDEWIVGVTPPETGRDEQELENIDVHSAMKRVQRDLEQNGYETEFWAFAGNRAIPYPAIFVET